MKASSVRWCRNCQVCTSATKRSAAATRALLSGASGHARRIPDRSPLCSRGVRILLLVVAAVGLLAGWDLFYFLTDDAYIAFRYVANAHEGRGLVWNPAPFLPVEGYTSFLWVTLLRGGLGADGDRAARLGELDLAGLRRRELVARLPIPDADAPAGGLGARPAAARRRGAGRRPQQSHLPGVAQLGARDRPLQLPADLVRLRSAGSGAAARRPGLGARGSRRAPASRPWRVPDGMLAVACAVAILLTDAALRAHPRRLLFALPLAVVPAHLLLAPLVLRRVAAEHVLREVHRHLAGERDPLRGELRARIWNLGLAARSAAVWLSARLGRSGRPGWPRSGPRAMPSRRWACCWRTGSTTPS